MFCRAPHVAVILASMTGTSPKPVGAQAHDTVWVWNAACLHPSMIAIQVRLDSTTLFRRSIPICRMERRSENGRASFRFTPHRVLVWYGYRSDEDASGKDPGDTTAPNTRFEVDLWQAGGEVDAIELGVTADAPDGRHMNTIHMLSPTEQAEAVLAPGLVLTTWPERRARVRRAASPRRCLTCA